MRAKKLSLWGLGVLSLILLVSFVSAAITLTLVTSPATLTDSSETTSFNVSANDLVNFSAPSTPLIIKDSNNKEASITIASSSNLNDVRWATFQANVTSVDEDFELGKFSSTVTINAVNATNASETASKTVTIYYENTKVCEYNDNGNLKINIEKLDVESGYGNDEEWFPLSEIEVEVEVKNSGNEDIRDIVIEWGLFNADLGEWVIDDQESKFKLKDGKKETVMINFELDDPDEFEEGDDYVFYVWATGEDEEFDQNETCVSDKEDIDMILESDFVILHNFQAPITAQCGEEVQISAEVWNIGEDDQDEVSILVYNKDLGILGEIIEMGDIDAFDNADALFDFIFEVPKNAEEKVYNLKFTVYDDDNDVFENDYDDEQAIFTVFLKVEGGCGLDSGEPDATVSASLETEAKAGEDLVVKVTISNIGDESVTYTLNAAGYTSWATSATLNLNTLSLAAGASGDVLITFQVGEDVEGEQTFDIEVLSANEMVLKQPISVLIEKSTGFGFTGAAIRDNPYMWGIGLINLILVIVIVIVAIRLARK